MMRDREYTVLRGAQRTAYRENQTDEKVACEAAGEEETLVMRRVADSAVPFSLGTG